MSTVDRHKVPWDSEGRERFLVVMGGIGEPSREERVLKGHAEKRAVKVCV